MKDALVKLFYSRRRNDIKIEWTCPYCDTLIQSRFLYTGGHQLHVRDKRFTCFAQGRCQCGNEVRTMKNKSWAEVTGLSTQVIDNRISDWRKEAELKFSHIE